MSKFGVWQPIESAPKQSVCQDGNNHYGEYVLIAYTGMIAPMRARWWFRDDSEACNFLADGGWAVYPEQWMPLPPAPGEQVGEMVGWISEKDLASLKAKTVWRPLLSTFKPKNDGEVLLYTAPPSTSALVEALEAIDRLDPHNDSTSEWNHAFGLVKAALAAHRKETA